MRRMGFVKRKASTGVKVDPEVFKELQGQYLSDIRSVATMEDIPPLTSRSDHQLGPDSYYVCASVKLDPQEQKGSKRVEIAGIDDKWKITATLTITVQVEGYYQHR